MSSRQIRQARRRLEAVQSGEMWPLTGSEQAKLGTLRARAAVKDARGSNPRKLAELDERIEQMWEVAERRLSAVVAGIEQAEAKKTQEQIDRTVARAVRGRRK